MALALWLLGSCLTSVAPKSLNKALVDLASMPTLHGARASIWAFMGIGDVGFVAPKSSRFALGPRQLSHPRLQWSQVWLSCTHRGPFRGSPAGLQVMWMEEVYALPLSGAAKQGSLWLLSLPVTHLCLPHSPTQASLLGQKPVRTLLCILTAQ